MPDPVSPPVKSSGNPLFDHVAQEFGLYLTDLQMHDLKATANAWDTSAPAPEQKKRILRLHLTREYWEAIRDGRKKVEYRLYDTWNSRISSKVFDEIHLFLGYPAAGDESRVIRRKWNGVTIRSQFLHPHFGDTPVTVLAIDVSVGLDD